MTLINFKFTMFNNSKKNENAHMSEKNTGSNDLSSKLVIIPVYDLYQQRFETRQIGLSTFKILRNSSDIID